MHLNSEGQIKFPFYSFYFLLSSVFKSKNVKILLLTDQNLITIDCWDNVTYQEHISGAQRSLVL